MESTTSMRNRKKTDRLSEPTSHAKRLRSDRKLHTEERHVNRHETQQALACKIGAADKSALQHQAHGHTTLHIAAHLAFAFEDMTVKSTDGPQAPA